MPFNDIEKEKEYQKKYRQTHREQIRECQKKYYQTHRGQILEYNQTHAEQIREKGKKYYQTHKEQMAEYYKKYNQEQQNKIKEIILKHGQCDKCGFTDLRTLQIHHIIAKNKKNSTWREKKEIVNGEVAYLILCANCHMILHNPRKLSCLPITQEKFKAS